MMFILIIYKIQFLPLKEHNYKDRPVNAMGNNRYF